MQAYEYRVVPAPKKGAKIKGVKAPEDRFAHALEAAMNELGADGWEYIRTDTLPAEERAGLTGKTTTFQNLMVFRRPRESAVVAAPQPAAEPAAAALPAPAAEADPATQLEPVKDEPTEPSPLAPYGPSRIEPPAPDRIGGTLTRPGPVLTAKRDEAAPKPAAD
ncbi:DUF4177 domain-containing protein [Pseudoroseicyclus sp. H15]